MSAAPTRAPKFSARIIVAVPTDGAAARLRALMRSLRPQLAGPRADEVGGVLVLVADAAADPVTARTVKEFLGEVPSVVMGTVPGLSPTPPAATDRAREPVAERNRLSVARNALVRAAARVAPEYRWLIWLDDDCRVLPGWFEAMTDAFFTADRGIVAGAVREVIPGRSPSGVHPAVARAPLGHDGNGSGLRHTRNLAIHRAVLEAVGSDHTREHFCRDSSPERAEYEFLLRARRTGAHVVWCPRAFAVREVPPDERSSRARLRGAYRVDREGAVVECHYDGPRASARLVGQAARSALSATGDALVARDSDTALRAGVGVVRALGRLQGLMDGTGLAVRERLRRFSATAILRPAAEEKAA